MPALLTGSEAIALGAMDAGCTFFAGYPITPASSLMKAMLARVPAAGGVAVQAEDEIAAIGFCLGAAMAGARALTATSGPGMSLYSENLGLAIMGEVPLVIVNVQRQGPATGGATTTAEGDVQFARWGTSGGYPLVVYAATDIADAYRLTITAFDTAERLRTPVILLTSKDLAMTTETVVLADLTAPGPVTPRRTGTGLPYAVAAPGDVPDFLPVGGDALTRFTGSTHDARGVITADRATADRALTHLRAKIDERADALALTTADLQDGADTLVVAYGAAARSARAAVSAARAAGERVSLLVCHTLWPVAEGAIRAALTGARRVVVPELNAGQYVREIERLAGAATVVPVTRTDGGLIEPAAIRQAWSA